MAVSFIERLNRLVRADAHGLIESLEDRALLLKQHLREAELEVQRKRARLDALTDEDRRLGEDARRLDAAVARLDEDTRLALGEGREDLARFAIRKLLPRRGEAAALRARLAEIDDEKTRLEGIVHRQESELEELRTRVRAAVIEARAHEGDDLAMEPLVADEEIEMELLRRLRSAEGAS